MQSTRATLLAAASVALTLACADEPVGMQHHPHRLAVEVTEEFHVGDDPEEHQFARVSGMAFAPDGRLVVLDVDNFAVTVWNASGERVGNWGREGEGPGEFPFRPGSLAVSDDGTVAVETGYRVDLFALSGDVADSRMVRPVSIQRIAFGADNALLAVSTRGRYGETNPRELLRLDDGEALWTWPPSPSLTGDGPISMWQPGPVFAQLWDGMVAVGRSDHYDIQVLEAATNRVVGRIARDVPLRGPSEEFMERLRQENIEIFGEDSPMVQRLVGTHPFAVVGKVFAGPPGRTIWIGRGTGIGDALAPPVGESMDDWTDQSYDLFDGATLEYLGTVELPEELTPMAGDATRVAGFQRGPFGIHSVRVLRVEVDVRGPTGQRQLTPSTDRDDR